MKKILLLGANGFLGRCLSTHLFKEGYEVKTASRTGDHIDFILDIGRAEDWIKIDFNPDIIVNCATILPGGSIQDQEYAKSIFHTNVWGTYQLCHWADEVASVQYILNISSLAVVNKPWPVPLTEEARTYPLGQHVLYTMSKLNQELILSSYPFKRQVKITHARLSALFGEGMPWNGIIPVFIDKVLNEEQISIINGNKVSVDLLYSKDACNHLSALLKSNLKGIVNIASGTEIFLIDLAKKIANIVGSDVTKINNIDDENTQESRALIDVSQLKSSTGQHINTELDIALGNTISYRKSLIGALN